MASLKSMQFFFPLLLAFSLCAHAAARKLHIGDTNRALMGSSSSYNAFDTNNPTPHNTNLNPHNTNLNYNLNYNPSPHNSDLNYNPSREELPVNYKDVGANESPHFTHGEFNLHNSDLNYNPSREELPVNYKDVGANESPHFTHGEFNPDSRIHGNSYDANLPYSSSSIARPNGARFGYVNGYDFHGPSSSSNTYRGNLPYSFESAFTNKQDGYGKHDFFPNNQQGSSSRLDNNGFIYSSPLTEDLASPSEEENLFQSSSNFDTNYTPSRTSATKFRNPEHHELASDNDNAFKNGFKKEKPVTNYDRFFNIPTIHQNEVKGSTITSPFGDPKFPLSGHDLTYGHVQVP